MFAERTNWRLTPNTIIVTLESLKQSDKTILDLTESNPTRCEFFYPYDQIFRAMSDPQNRIYTPCAQGLLKARKAVSNYYRRKNVEVPPERIFLTASTSEGYFFYFGCLQIPERPRFFRVRVIRYLNFL